MTADVNAEFAHKVIAAEPVIPQAASVRFGPSARPWFRCFVEQARPLPDLTPEDDGGPWRVISGVCGPLESNVRAIFHDDPLASRTLAVLADPGDTRTIQAALLAARDAVRTGQIVTISPGPAMAGFWATLHAEQPLVGITVLRAPLTPYGLRAARRLAGSIPGRYREFEIGADGSAAEPVMVPVHLPGGAAFPFGPRDVALIGSDTGAAGLALAQVLACSGAAVAVIGGSRDGALMAELDRLHAAGARVSFELADMTDHGAVVAAVERLESRLGRVTALCHATGTATRCALAELDYIGVGEELRLQAAVLDQMAAAVLAAGRTDDPRPVRLRHVITFGSVIGRYGLAGQGTLALASGALADQGRRLAGTIPGCRALHVDWPPWAGAGRGESAGLAEACARAGIAPMPTVEGSRQLLKLLATAGLPSRLAVHGRMGAPAPRQIAAPVSAVGARRAGRFIERVLAHYPGVELVAEATLSGSSDPYLADYQVDGVPVLPPTMALEAMAQAAAAVAGAPLRRVTQIAMNAPVVLPAGASGSAVVIRIWAQREADAVTVALRSGNSDFAMDHCTARFTPEVAIPRQDYAGTATIRTAARAPRAWMEGEDLYGRVCFQTGRFRRLTAIHPDGSRAANAVACGHDGLPWFGTAWPSDVRPGFGLVLGSAGLNDAALQLIQACVPHCRLTLAGCGAASFSGRVPAGLVTLRVTEVGPARAASQPAESVWNAEVVDATGQPLVTWAGLRMRPAGPLPQPGPWPVPLLAGYLERAATELGLGPGLHVDVSMETRDENATAVRGRPHRLVLRAEAAVPASAGWCQARTADIELAAGGPGSGGDWLAMLEELPRRLSSLGSVLPRQAGSQPAVSMAAAQDAAAQAAALASCLGSEAVPPDMTVQARHIVGVDWLVLGTGDASIVCTVLDVAGFGQTAFALMTGSPALPTVLVPPRQPVGKGQVLGRWPGRAPARSSLTTTQTRITSP